MARSVDPNIKIDKNQCKLNIGTWNVTSLTGKEIELTEEARKYQLDILEFHQRNEKAKEIFL